MGKLMWLLHRAFFRSDSQESCNNKLYSHYFIWPISCASSRRYSDAHIGDRWDSYGLYDTRADRNWQEILVT